MPENLLMATCKNNILNALTPHKVSGILSKMKTSLEYIV